ncbi:hypothetical protein ACUY1T_06710 [Billgrantia sp. Q4P2]|uniref:hypothetical protein n=1 Tax=Billgrantia sp. Q4P2 TaxID=3463857 RepID=UPI00405793C9
MLSRDVLKRIGVLGVTMGLAASPFAWSAGSDKYTDASGEKSGTSTMTEGASGTAGSSGSAGADAKQGTKWEEENGNGMELEGNGDGSDDVSSDPGAPGVEGGEGTQGGEEPDPSDTDSSLGEEEDET